MGFVYRARQISLNRDVALKMIKAGVLAQDDDLRRFQNEAEAVALLDHPGIVPIYEVGEHEGQRYFSMKLIEGGNLAEGLGRFARNPRAAAPLLIEVARAIQHAHARGVLHRDLKPANVLMDREGHPHITDFGLAKRIDSGAEMTQSGAIVGTPAYMSPEQAHGERGAITTATDIHGLGAIFYAMLTGAGPFSGRSVLEALDAVRTSPPEPPSRRNPKVPRDLELICLKCLEKEPADRYPGAGAVADDLGRYLAGEPVSVRAAGIMERAAKWARRKPTLAAAYTLGFIALILGGLGGMALREWRLAATAFEGEAKAKAASEKAREGEVIARAIAENARDAEARARGIADGLRKKVQRIEYGRRMEVMHQEYRDDNASVALASLAQTPVEFRGWEYRYLDRLCHFDLRTYGGHASNVTAAAYSPDASRIVTASYDGTAKIWDAATGAVIHTLRGNSGLVWSASFSPDGTRVLTAGQGDAAVQFPKADAAIVWDAGTGARALTLPTKGGFLQSASFSGDGARIVTGSDGTVQVWDAATGVEIRTLAGHEGAVKSARFSPDGSRIVTGGADGTARVWDAKSGAQLLAFKGHGEAVASASFSPDGSRVVTAGWDGTTRAWDARTGGVVLIIRDRAAQDAASFSPDGARIVTAGGNTAKVWDAGTGSELVSIGGHASAVTSACFSPDGSRVLTGSVDSTAKEWDSRTNAEWRALKAETRGETTASFSRDGTRVVTASNEKVAKIWDAGTGDLLRTLRGHAMPLKAAWFSPDGERVVTGSADGSVRFWDAGTGRPIFTLKGRSDGFVSPFSPDGSRVVTGGWETKSSTDAGSGFQFTIGASDATARVRDAKTGDEVLVLAGHKAPVTAAAFARDGSRIATASHDGAIKVWDARTGAELVAFRGNSLPVSSLSFSPDDAQVLSAGGMAIVWDARTGAEVFRLIGHTGWVSWAAYSPDEPRVVTASHDGSVKVWDLSSGAEVLSLKGSRGRMECASFSPDGSRIVTVGSGVRIWDATPIARPGDAAAPGVRP